MSEYADLAQKLKPYILPWMNGNGNAAAAAGGMAAHALSGSWHTGQLAQSQATWAATVTALNSHANNVDAHHAQDHVLATTSALGPDHTVSGLTSGQVLKATGATAARFVALTYAELTSRTHDILSEHSYSGGAALDVFGLSAASTLAKITPSSNPGGAAALLKSTPTGGLTLVALAATTSLNSPLLTTTATGLSIAPDGGLSLNPATYTTLPDGKELRSTTYASGFAGSGFLLDNNDLYAGKSFLEVDNLSVRGIMSVYELLIHQIRATNGSIIVANTGKISSRSLYAGSEGATNSEYTLNTDPEHGFAVGDLVRAQRWTGTGVYQSNVEVLNVFSATNFRGKLRSGDAPQVGYEFVRLGNVSDVNRQGGLYLTADDTGAPFMDVWNGVDAFADWNAAGTMKVRLGRLDGVTGDTNVYGLWAGDSTKGNLYATGTKVTLRQGTTEKISLSSDGNAYIAGVLTIGTAGELRQGTVTSGNVWDSLTNFTGLRMWRDGSIGRIGGYNTGTLQWGADTNGRLTFGGDNGLLDANGISLLVTSAVEDRRSYTFTSASGIIGGLESYTSGLNDITLRAKTTGNYQPRINVIAQGTSTYPGYIGLQAVGGTGNVLLVMQSELDRLSVTAGNTYFSGAVGVTGGLTTNGATSSLGDGLGTTTALLRLGYNRTDDGASAIYFTTDNDTYTDHGMRLVRSAGANGTGYLSHRGTGELGIIAIEAADIVAKTNNTKRLSILSDGKVGIGNITPTSLLDVDGNVRGLGLFADGEGGGVSGTTGLTNGTVTVSTGTGTVKMAAGTARNSDLWLKFYVGTTPYYVPAWSNIN